MKHFRLGMVGAENSHSSRIADLCNLQEIVPVRVACLWSETAELAATCARDGKISCVVEDWREMVGKVDGVMIDHRHGGQHAEVARYFLERNIPTFVDKPMTCDLAEARELFSLAERRGVPLMTFSAKPLAPAYQSFFRKVCAAGPVRAFHSIGPAEMNSPYGGVFFYGIHQVDCAIEVLGCEVVEVSAHRLSDADGSVTMVFRSGAVATLHLLSGPGITFRWTAAAGGKVFLLRDRPDPLFYEKSARLIHGFLRSGNAPFSRERMLAPIAVLEAVREALVTGRTVRVDAINRISPSHL